MKAANWKEVDRALSERAKGFSIAWDRGTFNEGRNKAKAERRAIRYGSGWSNPRATVQRPTKAVAPAYPGLRISQFPKRDKVLTKAPRDRKGSTTPMWMRRLRNRRRDALRRAS